MGQTHADVREKTITPAQAAVIIRRNDALTKADPTKKQRHLKKSVVERYAADMRAGRWQFNAETVKLASDGHIIDGRHRLAACVAAGVSFRTLIAEGVDSETFRSIDIGSPRTGSDLMFIDGHLNTHVLASALAHLWRWERGGNRSFVDFGTSPSKLVLFEVLDRHPEIEAFCSKAYGVGKLMSVGLAATCWYIFAKQDAVLADLFFNALNTGLGLKDDDPVYVLRERLLRDRGAKPRPQISHTADVVIRAWNATRKGQKLERLQRPRTEGKSDAYRLSK